MPRQKLITRLLETNQKSSHLALFKENSAIIDLELAEALKNTYYNSWTTEPRKTRNAALALETLFTILPDLEVKALANWVKAIAELTEGKTQSAIQNINDSFKIFISLKKSYQAAQTQVSKLYALALLGRYDEAIECAKDALKVFEEYGDELAAGKIEKNLGNIVSRQENHFAAENYYLSAYKRFSKLKDAMELTMCENGLAMTYTALNDFRTAEKFYKKALFRANESEMVVTQAEIEASMGNLFLFRAKFDQALKFLELSRQKYEKLEMPHQMAVAELEIADAYLELNLVSEAFESYGKIVETLADLKMQGEEARARVNHARAAIALGKKELAKLELEKSAKLYQSEKNLVGEAFVKLIETQLAMLTLDYEKAFELAQNANQMLVESGNFRYSLLAKWLQGEVLFNLKKYEEAKNILSATFDEALKQENSYLAQAIQTTLGRIALNQSHINQAEIHFKKAIKLIEILREPLPAEDFRIAFLGDKLLPYQELAKIYLLQGKTKAALLFIEQSRSRALADNLNNNQNLAAFSDETTKIIYQRLADLREELNWYYSRLNRVSAEENATLFAETKIREKKINELMRQVKNIESKSNISSKSLSLKRLQTSLGKEKALIEYVSFDGKVSAFVLTKTKLEFVKDLADETEIGELLEGLHFQFETMRYGNVNLGNFVNDLKKRTDIYLQKLYNKIFRPLENLVKQRNLVFVPFGKLHYLPFAALHNGVKYLTEEREISFSPSATVLQNCLEKELRPLTNALLIGVADEKIPFALKEIESLKKILPDSLSLKNKKANFSNFKKNAGNFDIVHFACHGQFRSDNPMFSSLQLADGLLTARDISEFNLKAELVVLSACETGMNKILAGEELLGLTRGFLSAGVSSLVLTLWTVDDKTARELMIDFYLELKSGKSPATALRNAQRNLIKQNSHPYYWSPFFLVGK